MVKARCIYLKNGDYYLKYNKRGGKSIEINQIIENTLQENGTIKYIQFYTLKLYDEYKKYKNYNTIISKRTYERFKTRNICSVNANVTEIDFFYGFFKLNKYEVERFIMEII